MTVKTLELTLPAASLASTTTGFVPGSRGTCPSTCVSNTLRELVVTSPLSELTMALTMALLSSTVASTHTCATSGNRFVVAMLKFVNCGATVSPLGSTVHVWLAVLVLPASSTARIVTVKELVPNGTGNRGTTIFVPARPQNGWSLIQTVNGREPVGSVSPGSTATACNVMKA